MENHKSTLLEVIEKIKNTPILVVGDIMLDRYIWGSVDRISPEAPVPVVFTKKIENRLGGAGNVVRNLCAIGAKVTLCGFIGNDQEGVEVLNQLKELGVEKSGVLIDRDKPTILKTRVVAQNQQVVRIDREDLQPPAKVLSEGIAAVIDSYLDSNSAVIVSDYGKGTISEVLLKRIELAKEKGRVSITKCPIVLDPHPANYHLYKKIDAVKPNRKEAEAASGVKITDRESAYKAALVLLEKWQAQMMLITLGEKGLCLVEAGKKDPFYLDTIAVEVFDVSGAGDTVTSLFTAAIAVGASPRIAAEIANIAAGIVVTEVGTAAINLDKLRDEIELIDSLKQALDLKNKKN